jgi:hypothetical protein
MIDRLTTFIEHFESVTYDAKKFFYMARAKELQEDACQNLLRLRGQVTDLKNEFIAQGDEESSNTLLSAEYILDAFISELRTWIALKEDNASAAWDFFVDAQMAAHIAIQAHAFGERLNHYIYRLEAVEKILFPHITFVSPGFVIESGECSICGQPYGDCDHIKGRAYMGQMCVNNVTKIKHVREVSIVDEPASKHCRVLNFTDNGITRDIMTWRVTNGAQSDNSHS